MTDRERDAEIELEEAARRARVAAQIADAQASTRRRREIASKIKVIRGVEPAHVGLARLPHGLR